MKKDNIIFFFSDQQRFDTLGCNGQKLPLTPNIDQLAQEGTNFTNTFTPQPVCGPARACLQSGLYPTQTGCYRNAIPLPLDIPTLAKQIGQADYDVAYVGKWHLASDEGEHRYETSAIPLERRGGYNDYWMASDLLEFTSHGYDGYIHDRDNNRVDFKGYRTDCITDYALDYINGHNGEKPFFLFLSHIEPHHQNDHFNFEGPVGSVEKFADYEQPADLHQGEGDWETFMPDYLGCCNALDKNLGRVVQALKEKGIYENTTVIYTSDHGCHFRTKNEKTENGYDDYKRNSFENTIHVPLIIKGNGFGKGVKEEKLVSLIDLPKTMLALAQAEIPSSFQGYSLLEQENQRDFVYIQISESYVGRAIRTERYKYVVYAPEKHPWDDSCSDRYEERYLFDLETDPLEQNNLLQSPEHQGLKQELQKLLKQGAEIAKENPFEIVS